MPIKRVIVAIPKVVNSMNNFLFEGMTSLCLLHIFKVNITQLTLNVIFQFPKKSLNWVQERAVRGQKFELMVC